LSYKGSLHKVDIPVVGQLILAQPQCAVAELAYANEDKQFPSAYVVFNRLSSDKLINNRRIRCDRLISSGILISFKGVKHLYILLSRSYLEFLWLVAYKKNDL